MHDYLTDDEIREMLGIRSRSTLKALRVRDKTFPVPVYFTPGKRVTPRHELEAWWAARLRIAKENDTSRG